ncbi:hypothetical protein [Acidovorax sp. JHL-9]|uniref:hypothetical protein n=1 Tax=Acidovorax sp. JHL-9 TaxID=1276756 RepID=UPI0003FB477D
MSPARSSFSPRAAFFLLIAIELAVGIRRQRNTYHLADAVSSIRLGVHAAAAHRHLHGAV